MYCSPERVDGNINMKAKIFNCNLSKKFILKLYIQFIIYAKIPCLCFMKLTYFTYFS